MQQLLQSDFLLALGKAITASFWQMALLFLLYQLLVAIFRIKHSSVKNFLSSLFALAGFGWFISTIFSQWNKQLSQTASVVVESNNTALFSAFTKSNQWQLLLNWIEYKFNFILPYLSVAYLFVLGWFMLKLFVQVHKVNSLKRNGMIPVSEDMQTFFNYLIETTGLSSKTKLFISTQIDIPATIGFLKPIILLPITAVTHLTPAQLEAVLLHEISHIKRNDYFWNILLTTTETILFFNPFALLLIGTAKRERENSCDDFVMKFQQNAPVYAEALLNVEKARRSTPKLAMALGDDKHLLKNRIKRILNLPAEKNKISSRLAALVFLTIVFATTGWVVKNNNHTTSKKVAVSDKNSYLQNTIFIKPETVLKKSGETVSLIDEKRKMRLVISKELKHQSVRVWDEKGKQVLFDKLVMRDIPEEWMELMMRPRMNHLPPPPPGRNFINDDSVRESIQRKTNGRRELSYYNFDVQRPMQKMTYFNAPIQEQFYFHNRNSNDTTNHSFVFTFPQGDFVMPEFPDGDIYIQQQNIQQQKRAAELSKQHIAQLKLFNRRMMEMRKKQDSLIEKQWKNKLREMPDFVYLNDMNLIEQMRNQEKQVIIFTEQPPFFFDNEQLPDTTKMKKQPPHVVIRKLQISRL